MLDRESYCCHLLRLMMSATAKDWGMPHPAPPPMLTMLTFDLLLKGFFIEGHACALEQLTHQQPAGLIAEQGLKDTAQLICLEGRVQGAGQTHIARNTGQGEREGGRARNV